MAGLARCVDGVVGADVELMCDSELRESFISLRREIDRQEAFAAELLASLHHRKVPVGDGASSTPVWVQAHTGQRHADARAALETALAVESLPLTSKAWRQGEVTSSAARSIARGRRAGYEDVYGEIEDTLVEFAAARDYRSLDAMVRHYQVRADALDDKDPAELNGLHLSQVGNRWALSADLDDLSGKFVDAAIHAALDKPIPEDTRMPERRRADALTDVCRFFLDHADLPVEGGEAPHVGIVVGYERITNGAPGLPGETALDLPSIAELLCEASLSRIVVGPDSIPLDVGRAMRNPSKALRKAVMVRDGGCRFPGCDRRPNWCHTHHCKPWECGGDTKLCNLVCLCSFHHHLIHRPGWIATFDGVTFTVTAPDGRCIGSTQARVHR